MCYYYYYYYCLFVPRTILSDVGVDMGLITEQKEEFDKEHELSILRDVIKRTFVYIKR